MQTDIRTFVTGYLCARNQSAVAQVEELPWGITVRYGPGMDREVEHFVWDPAAGLRPSHGDWLTVFGDGVPVGRSLSPLADECFMATRLAALCEQVDPAPFTALPAFESPAPGVARFRHEVDGHAVASVCCAIAPDGHAVLDRLATDPAYRGRGMARNLMRAAAAWALASGCERLLLISSPQGQPLYRGLGLRALAPVRVFRLDGPG